MVRQGHRAFPIPARVAGSRSRFGMLALACVLTLLTQFVMAPPASAAAGVKVASPGDQAAPTGIAFSRAMSAQEGTAPYTWSAAALPPGLSIDATTGVVAGVPSTAGTYATSVTATDATGIAGTVSFTFVTGVIV